MMSRQKHILFSFQILKDTIYKIYGKNSARPGMVTIRAGSVNEKAIIKPIRNLFIKSKVPSTPLDQTLEACDGMPLQ
jgi:hypothetical protein